MNRLLLGAIPVAMAGCIQPGQTIHVIGVTPASVVLEYTHSYDSEYPIVIQRAEAICQQYGKHARPAAGSPTRLGTDRSRATFDCT